MHAGVELAVVADAGRPGYRPRTSRSPREAHRARGRRADQRPGERFAQPLPGRYPEGFPSLAETPKGLASLRSPLVFSWSQGGSNP
jgi:hypothetical protein